MSDDVVMRVTCYGLSVTKAGITALVCQLQELQGSVIVIVTFTTYHFLPSCIALLVLI